MRRPLKQRDTMDGLGRHDKLGQPFTLLIPFHSVSHDKELCDRSSGANLGVEFTNDDLEEREPLQIHRERFELLFFLAWC
ncbi:unnamed protein product [Haemonchus placei]|uniref:Uncharacterized protein n=1 Tax=Haemonchus placei TaxID=6290 RepID=A0A0N4W5A4_HAEPC|nr:unnamed protein product [Haemonchus placei]